MTIDITPILSAITVLISAIITVFIVPWIKKKTAEQGTDELLKWIDIAVAAAQQLYYQENGVKRKEYVVNFLKEKGYDVDLKEIDGAIEAAVLRLHKELESKQ